MFSILSNDESSSSFVTPVKAKNPQVPNAPKKILPPLSFYRTESFDRIFSDDSCEGQNSDSCDSYNCRSYGGYSSDDCGDFMNYPLPIVNHLEIPLELEYETSDNEKPDIKIQKITKISYPNLTVEKTSDHLVTSKAVVIGYVSVRRTHQLKKKEKDTKKKKAKDDRKKAKEDHRRKVRVDRQKVVSKDDKEMKNSTVRTRVDVRTVHPDIQNDGDDNIDYNDRDYDDQEMKKLTARTVHPDIQNDDDRDYDDDYGYPSYYGYEYPYYGGYDSDDYGY